MQNHRHYGHYSHYGSAGAFFSRGAEPQAKAKTSKGRATGVLSTAHRDLLR